MNIVESPMHLRLSECVSEVKKIRNHQRYDARYYREYESLTHMRYELFH